MIGLIRSALLQNKLAIIPTDTVYGTREKMHADLVVAMGGRAAEEIIFGRDKVTSGASSDIMQATDLARSMVTKWGMSDKVGRFYPAFCKTWQ